jgi:hypothetical protein
LIDAFLIQNNKNLRKKNWKNFDACKTVIVPYELEPYTQHPLGVSFTVLVQVSKVVKSNIGPFLNEEKNLLLCYITYDDKPVQSLSYLNKRIAIEPVYLVHLLRIYEIKRLT